MSRVRVSGLATSDLDAIWDYIAGDNPLAADRMVDQIFNRCQSYANQSELGELRPELGADLRCFSVGFYVVYYRPIPDGIELVRVLHGARDVGRHF